MKKNQTRSYLMLISSMLIFGTIGIFRKYVTLSSAMLAFSRGLLGSAFLAAFLMLRGHKRQKIGTVPLLLLMLTGGIIGLNWIFLFESYRYTSLATATMCYYMQPTIVIFLSAIILKERLTVKKLLCAAAAILGMVFVSGILEGNGLGTQDAAGIFFGLGAALFYAVVIILNKRVSLEDSYERTFIQLLSDTVVLLPYLLVTEDWSSMELSGLTVAMVLLIGIVHTGFAYTLYFGSMNALRAQSIAVLSYIDPVFALFLSAAVLHEALSVMGILGAALIIGSALLSELPIGRH